MYSCTMPVPDPGPSPPPKKKKAASVLKNRVLYDIASIFGNGFGLVKVWGVLGGLGCFLVVWCVSMDRYTVMLTVK